MDEKERNMKKIGRKMSICMALTLSFFLSLIGMISSGHFEPVGWIINFAASAVISLIIGFLIPIKKVTDSASAKFNLQPGRFSTRCFESLICDLIFTPFITLCMILLAYSRIARTGARFLPMFFPALGICMAAGFFLILIFTPLFLRIIVGNPDR